MSIKFGQGKIDFDIKKPAFKKKVAVEDTIDIPGFKIINIEPKITWQKRPLPTKIPFEGFHGGAIFRRYSAKDTNKNLGDINSYNLEVYVPEVGFGAGGIVVSGSGPVLQGVGSLGRLTSIYLPWIVLLLLISAIIWAVTHMRCKKTKKLHIRQISKKKEVSETFGNQMNYQISGSRDVSDHNSNIQSLRIEEDMTKFIPVQMNASLSHAPSLSNYSNSVRHSLTKSVKSNNTKVGSTASILSFTSTLVGSRTYGIMTQMHMKLKQNELVVNQESGVVFTVSETNSPNSYFRQDSETLNLCHSSIYKECLEVFLLCQDTILVGKMKNNGLNNSIEPFIIESWSTIDGNIYKNKNDLVECTCMCTLRDEYLVAISTKEMSLIHLPSYDRISRIESPFSVVRINHNASTIQATKDMNYVVISELISQTLSIYVWDFEGLRQGELCSRMKTYSNDASAFSLITSLEIIVALNSNKIVLWNFVDKTEDIVLAIFKQDIQRLDSSPTGQLLLVQFATRLSALETDNWEGLYNIPVFSEQICSMSFSSLKDGCIFLAIALDNGNIPIYHSLSGQLLRTLSISVPVTFLLFDERKLLLYALSDRASHYQMSIFPIT